MPGDGLHDPLGAVQPRGNSPKIAPALLVKIALVALVLGLGAYVAARDDGGHGEPFVVATIEHPAPRLAPPAGPDAQTHEGSNDDGSSRSGAGQVRTEGDPADVETQFGVNVVRLRAAAVPGSLILKVPQSSANALAARGLAAAPDPRLVEKSSFGPLPKIGADGTRPAITYARPASRDPAAAAGKPRIAILIGGMGLNQAATAEAAKALPAAVSFGFAPYGDEVDAQVKSARESGHEVVLQLPMEDFGHAESSLSHMLLAEQSGNRERLHWLMSRFTGYAGVSNYLGGRFLADEEALRPVLQDLAARGLFFVDDGTAPRSLVAALASESGLPSVRADVVLDAKPDPAAINEALGRLEAQARQRGWAVGTASALPATNALLARYSANIAAHGFGLVPISEIASLPQSILAGSNLPPVSVPAAASRPDGGVARPVQALKP